MPATQYAFRQYTGDGSTTTFAVPFPYLLKAHVKVYTGYDLASGTYTSLLADGTGYTWTSATQIQTTTAPASGVVLTVIRQTPTSTQLVQWQDGSNLIASDIDTADKQNLYVVQEQLDRGEAISTQSQAAKANADAALASVVNALPYVTYGTVALIPTSPQDGDRIEVTNSAGIESFTPLTGLPSGFVGSASTKVKLAYSSAASTWSWVEYLVNDPLNLFLQASGGSVTGPIRLANGSAALPSLAFTADTSTGIRFVPGTGLGFSVSGAQRASMSATIFSWGAPTGDCGIFVGLGATANRGASLSLAGDATYPDWGTRLLRSNTGANASSALSHRGTGPLVLQTVEAGAIRFDTSGLERARITADGNLALGSVGAAGLSFQNAKPLTGATTTYGQLNQGTVQSDCTSAAVYYASTASTQAAAFTLNNLYNFLAQQATIGAGSAVTTQYGFAASSNLIGATTNIGFHSALPSGTGRWNFYAAGTADSYFASNNFIFANGGTERARVDPSGRLLVGISTAVAGSAAKLQSSTTLNLGSVATYADNAAATAGGLAVGDVYRTATGQLMIRY